MTVTYWLQFGLVLGIVALGPWGGQQAATQVEQPPSEEEIAAGVMAHVERQVVVPRLGHEADATRDIQAALDTGRSVLLEPGTYLISRTLLMHANQRLAGAGTGVVLKASAQWDGTGSRLNRFTLLSNVGYEGPDIVDANIAIENLSIDASEITHSNGGFHGIALRKTRDVLIRGVKCYDIGDCTAILASDRTLVTQSEAAGITNVGFDHWDGPRNARVSHVSVHTKEGGDGVMFTAATTLPNKGRAGDNLTADDVKVYGPMNVGVTANILADGGKLANVSFSHIMVDVERHPNSAGVILSGDISGGSISFIKVIGLNGGQAIALRPDRWGVPSDIRVENVDVPAPVTSAKNVAPIVALGKNHRISNCTISGGTYNYAVWIDDDSTQVNSLHAPPGKLGTILNRTLDGAHRH